MLSNGAPLTAVDVKAKVAADLRANEAAEEHRVPAADVEDWKEAEKKAVKVINNAADRNQDIADKARAEAFESVVSQEAEEKENTGDIAASHKKAGDEASANEKAGLEAYDYQRRGTAPAARDSMRFVDTENEGLNGVKYGGRASLAQAVK